MITLEHKNLHIDIEQGTQMSFKNYEESGQSLDLDLLIILYLMICFISSLSQLLGPSQCMGRFLGIIGQHPSVSRSSRLVTC